MQTTPITHGRLPYLCSAKTSAHTYCTSNADVVTDKNILCSSHYAKQVAVEVYGKKN